MTTLVTIPGIMSDARTWAPLAEGLKDRVSAVHLADTTLDDTLSGMAARALAQTHGPLIVAAHSMGGRVALEMGRQAPERIRAMILSSTGAEGPAADEQAKREARIAEANADMVGYARNWAPKVLSTANAQNAELVARVRQMVEDCPAEVHARQNIALLHRPDATSYIGNFDFPVLLVTGDQDHLATEEVHGAIAAQMKDAESRVIPGSGHLLPFEQPQAVLETVTDWLDRKAIR
ncbi:alpha/beta fold hydrolase [Phaeovulum sp. W22_SRMD_FR3]|uniref:alpha/beta fold hydrolase n=1 Tax=Phaeovulum sp. W22_SRMD_FR3 TaxID=3240274 RepID=UPI003F95FDE6